MEEEKKKKDEIKSGMEDVTKGIQEGFDKIFGSEEKVVEEKPKEVESDED